MHAAGCVVSSRASQGRMRALMIIPGFIGVNQMFMAQGRIIWRKVEFLWRKAGFYGATAGVMA